MISTRKGLETKVQGYKDEAHSLLHEKYGFSKISITKGLTKEVLEAGGLVDKKKIEIPKNTIEDYLAIRRLYLDAHSRLSKAESDEETLRGELEEQNEAYEELKAVLVQTGPIEKALETVFLPTINVSRSAYFGGGLVGAMIQRILKEESRTSLWAFFVSSTRNTTPTAWRLSLRS
jgi:hypothetical protein